MGATSAAGDGGSLYEEAVWGWARNSDEAGAYDSDDTNVKIMRGDENASNSEF